MQVTEKRSNKDQPGLMVFALIISTLGTCARPQGDFAWRVPSSYTRRRTREPKAGKRGGKDGQGRKNPGEERKPRGGKNPGEETPPKKMPARAADTRPV